MGQESMGLSTGFAGLELLQSHQNPSHLFALEKDTQKPPKSKSKEIHAPKSFTQFENAHSQSACDEEHNCLSDVHLSSSNKHS